MLFLEDHVFNGSVFLRALSTSRVNTLINRSRAYDILVFSCQKKIPDQSSILFGRSFYSMMLRNGPNTTSYWTPLGHNVMLSLYLNI